MRKNLEYCRSHSIDTIDFVVHKGFTGYAEHLLYLLNIHAQHQFEKKIGIKPDICLLKHCVVLDGQQTIFPTEKTEYKLFSLDYEAGIIEELLGGTRRKTKNHQFLTTSGSMVNGHYTGLLISKKDIEKTLFNQ